jgi:AraC-like DNA-binding protein
MTDITPQPLTLEEKMIQAEAMILASLENSKPPNIPDVAKKFGISTKTFSTAFKARFGCPFYDYYLVKKMQHARILLERDPALTSVSEISNKLGYKKMSNFIAVFRKYQGQTPGQVLGVR